jgi:hypothetical protein
MVPLLSSSAVEIRSPKWNCTSKRCADASDERRHSHTASANSAALSATSAPVTSATCGGSSQGRVRDTTASTMPTARPGIRLRGSHNTVWRSRSRRSQLLTIPVSAA